MKKKLYIFLDKLLKVNYQSYIIKYMFLFWELFISLQKKTRFVLFGISYKWGKLKINKYYGESTEDGIKLLALIKKYESIFIKFFEILQKSANQVGDESDFINIFDKTELTYEEIWKILNFTFVDDYTYRRRSEMDFTIEDKSELSIYHSDFECSKCSWPKEAFTNFPDFRNDIIDKKYFKEDICKKNYTQLYTNITDYESITMWWNQKINEILSNKKLIKNYDLISINKTCISVIMGDDVKSVLLQNKIPLCKTVYTDQNIDSGYKAILSYLKEIKLNNNIGKTNQVVFFGLAKNKNTYELIKFLENNLNIKVWNIILPAINKKDLQEILKYKFAVFFDWKKMKVKDLFKLYPIDYFEVKVPYSLTNSYLFYKKILGKFWKTTEKLENIIESLKQEKKWLFDKAKNYMVGFIISSFHIDYFLQDNFRWVDLLQTLWDMWFDIKFFVSNFYWKENLDKLNKLREKYEVVFSNEKNKLDDFLKDEKISLYYSEVNNDKRIFKYDKCQFSIWDFEYGIDGFFRTLERFVKKCEKVDYIKKLV